MAGNVGSAYKLMLLRHYSGDRREVMYILLLVNQDDSNEYLNLRKFLINR